MWVTDPRIYRVSICGRCKECSLPTIQLSSPCLGWTERRQAGTSAGHCIQNKTFFSLNGRRYEYLARAAVLNDALSWVFKEGYQVRSMFTLLHEVPKVCFDSFDKCTVVFHLCGQIFTSLFPVSGNIWYICIMYIWRTQIRSINTWYSCCTSLTPITRIYTFNHSPLIPSLPLPLCPALHPLSTAARGASVAECGRWSPMRHIVPALRRCSPPRRRLTLPFDAAVTSRAQRARLQPNYHYLFMISS